jgi:hypothetical protein
MCSRQHIPTFLLASWGKQRSKPRGPLPENCSSQSTAKTAIAVHCQKNNCSPLPKQQLLELAVHCRSTAKPTIAVRCQNNNCTAKPTIAVHCQNNNCANWQSTAKTTIARQGTLPKARGAKEQTSLLRKTNFIIIFFLNLRVCSFAPLAFGNVP